MSLSDIIEDFNNATLELISIVEDTVKNTDTYVLFKTAKKKVEMVMNADPVFMLESGGEYIYKYRDVITKGDFDDFILNTDKYIQEDDLKDIKSQTSKSSSDEVSSAELLLKYVRDKWSEYTHRERKVVKRLVKTMLSNHCKYKIYLIQESSRIPK